MSKGSRYSAKLKFQVVASTVLTKNRSIPPRRRDKLPKSIACIRIPSGSGRKSFSSAVPKFLRARARSRNTNAALRNSNNYSGTRRSKSRF